MSSQPIYITVNTSEDYTEPKQGLTTLRQAIVKFNDLRSWNNGPAYINFELSGQKSPSSWTIAPEWPLPPILSGNVYLNYTDPKNIILSGEKLNPNAKNSTFTDFYITDAKRQEYFPWKYHNPNANPHSSLLTIGEAALSWGKAHARCESNPKYMKE